MYMFLLMLKMCISYVTVYFYRVRSCKRRKVDNLAHIYLFISRLDSLRNAVFALCFLKCLFIQMLF